MGLHLDYRPHWTHLSSLMCLVDIFHMSLHISFGAKDLFALGTFNIGMDIHVLFHLLVIYERSCISFHCALFNNFFTCLITFHLLLVFFRLMWAAVKKWRLRFASEVNVLAHFSHINSRPFYLFHFLHLLKCSKSEIWMNIVNVLIILVSHQVIFPGKLFLTLGAVKNLGRIFQMNFHMAIKIVLPVKFFSTWLTSFKELWLLHCVNFIVNLHMSFQVSRFLGFKLALCTFIYLLLGAVFSYVVEKLSHPIALFTTVSAFKRFLCVHRIVMQPQLDFIHKTFSTFTTQNWAGSLAMSLTSIQLINRLKVNLWLSLFNGG